MKLRENDELLLSAAEFAGLVQAVLAKDRAFRFCARGTSMTPFIRDGDIVTIAPMAGLAPRMGEVVAFCRWKKKDSGLVIHRIVGCGSSGFAVQGDGNACTQEFVASEEVLGRVVKVERAGRAVRFGLGPERRLLAWLSRGRLIWKLVWPVWRRLPPVFKQRNSCT
ncbi:MAG: S24/S26 family peptidase [Desulfomonile tiedjei]|nr:S24/S26 family peptidase [Desulfomonile tiedjei]